MDSKSNLVFLNTPVLSTDDDIIGVETHVKKLSAAIDSGAQMIAITSPFGAGKTSIIEMLKVNRKKKPHSKEKAKMGNEKVVNISMWSNLDSQKTGGGETANLHRTFLYQLISQIKPRRASYIIRRLNPNYGLFRIHTNKMRFWILTIIALFMLVTTWAINSVPEAFAGIIPKFISDHSAVISVLTFALSIIIGLILLTRADIVYSKKNTGSTRTIDTDEIIDLYKTELLRPLLRERKHAPKFFRGKYFIVVIEDLDRTSDQEAVISFLAELKKYCIIDCELKYKNKITFIVNIKPESELTGDNNHNATYDSEKESLFAKIFDYVLLLQTINVDNYDAILEGLLSTRKDQLNALGLKFDMEHIADTLPGMQWIIRERRIGIREIKERLNITFSLYESLKEKFSESNVSLEKCAAVAYLTTAFEKDLNSMSGREFAQLVDYYIANPKADFHSCNNVIPDASDDFKKTVWQLIDAKLIDSSYRSYFYNYPKTSKLYTADESKIINALLYGEVSPDIGEIADRVHEAGSMVILNGLRKIEQLGIQLPAIVLDSEVLYLETLKFSPELLYKKLRQFDYSDAGAERTIQTIIKLLSYDKSRSVYDKQIAKEYCTIWNENFSEPSLLQLRNRLCEIFPNEIRWYAALFSDGHAIISEKEMDFLALTDIVNFVNVNASDFSIDVVQYVQKRFAADEPKEKNYLPIKRLLTDSLRVLDTAEIAEVLLNFMLSSHRIVPEFESEVFSVINTLYLKKPADQPENNLFDKYQRLISVIAAGESLSKDVLSHISKLEHFGGYSENVANQLYESEYYLDFILLSVTKNYKIDFMDANIISAMEDNKDYVLSNHKDLFDKLRLQIASTNGVDLNRYLFMFDDTCPIMTSMELEQIRARGVDSDELIMRLIPESVVTVENTDMLCKYFCRKTQLNSIGYQILMYISKFDKATAENCFVALDFGKIRYKRMSAERKAKIKLVYTEILKLNTPGAKLRFMELTQCLDSKWETDLVEEMRVHTDLHERYINLISQGVKMTGTTVNVICKLPIRPMPPLVNEKLFEAKKYIEYVSSKTAYDGAFTMEDKEKESSLWNAYLQIFQSTSHKRTIKYMIENKSFLLRIMAEHAYREMSKESIMQLTGALQSADCIKDVHEIFGTEFALQYYSSIDGFQDRNAAKMFVDIVLGDSKLLKSESLYNNTHSKLIDGLLKAKYTRARNKIET